MSEASRAVPGRAAEDTAILILDYGMGNLRSVEKALEHVGARAAIGADPDESPLRAPYTFPMVVAFRLMGSLMTDPSVGIELHNVVHRDERIDQVRPVRAGDALVGELTVESVKAAAGVDMIGTRTVISTVEGEAVCTATATLVHRGVSA